MDAINRAFGINSVVSASNVFGPGASYAVPSSTLPRGVPVPGSLGIAPGSTTVSKPVLSEAMLKNVSAFASAAAGVGGLAEGLGTSRNLKAIRKQESRALKRDAKRTISQAAVNYRKGGVLAEEGTPIDVLAQSADEAEMDQAWLKWRYRLLQTQSRISGATDGTSGFFTAGNTLLSKRGR